MKLPRRIQGLVDSVRQSFAQPDVATLVRQQHEAEQAAKRELAAQDRLANIRRLAPFAGRLFLLTDFGPFEGVWPEHASRTVEALGSAGLRTGTRVGTSVHLGSTRDMDGWSWQFSTQAAVTERLQGEGYDAVLPPPGDAKHYKLAEALLGTLVSAAEATAESAEGRHRSDAFGHLAVVEAMQLSEIGISIRNLPHYDNGSLFVLHGVDAEQGQLNWQLIAAEPQPQI